MDSGSVADWVSATANIIVAITAVVAAAAAIMGLSSWRSEMIGQRRMELAEDVLTDFYEARDTLGWVRSPMAYGEESQDRKGRDDENDALRSMRDSFYVTLKRLSNNSEFFSRIRARRHRVRAAFGDDAAAHYEALWSIHSEIAVAARMGLRLRDPDLENPRTQEQIDRYQAVIWEGLVEDDPITRRIDQLIAAVEARFRREIDLTDVGSAGAPTPLSSTMEARS